MFQSSSSSLSQYSSSPSSPFRFGLQNPPTGLCYCCSSSSYKAGYSDGEYELCWHGDDADKDENRRGLKRFAYLEISTKSRRHSTDDQLGPGLASVSARPYLCTGYDICLVWEPCAMCAIALVHQRIRRIFYALPNPHAGALGSVHRLQGEKSLNHRYAVFKVVLPKELLDMDEIARTSENDKSANMRLYIEFLSSVLLEFCITSCLICVVSII
ncbi:hypothetical protein Dsin_016492 [Dipteronia sinensis]|uniref:CMP/dCMP-type deaminase domain-containing protein n=1 Tax=Dipteronia sinensis TaxID=43782 RepID=A0AAE0ADV5_9ROSI|nr:hypothetical protein Dsin_016492 [Dipteronia sinensis]